MKTPKQAGSEPQARPLECRDCGCNHFSVYSTRRHATHIDRVRICRNCSRRLRTRETIEQPKDFPSPEWQPKAVTFPAALAMDAESTRGIFEQPSQL